MAIFASVSMVEAKPKVAILATGGTIVGSTDSKLATTGYTAGVLGIDTLIQTVPDIKDLAKITGEQIANVDSLIYFSYVVIFTNFPCMSAMWIRIASDKFAVFAISNTQKIPTIRTF